ncbi:hypothetical protein GCM10022252_25230 [Streptosporangium oxazolinicum]|uniref:Uncharacterized protein n=1 Tax=Streptosporangium oxazolinicum TaxID=909287 RepID=A0ABP8ARU9_9ACTN
MIDPDSTQAVPASGRHRVRHWEDTEGYRTRPPYSPPPAAATDPRAQSPEAAPTTPPRPSPTGPPTGSGPGRLVYREEALRRHAEARATARMPLVISGPSFLLLWIVVVAVLAAGAALVMLALGTGGLGATGLGAGGLEASGLGAGG